MDQQKQAKSRTQRHNSNKKTTTKPKKKSSNKTIRIPFLLVIILAFIALIIGGVIGYSVIGKENPAEVFDIDTWMHLYNLIFG